MIIENLKSLAEVMSTLEQLDTPEFVAEQGLSEEDVTNVRADLQAKLSDYKGEVQSYIEYKLTERQDHQILSLGIAEKMKILAERKQAEDKKIEKIDSWIDYLCKFAGITGLKTPIAEIKYTGGEKMKIIDDAIPTLPDELKKYQANIIVSPEDKKIIEKMGYLVTLNHIGLPEIKKRYKELSEEQKKELEGKIRIDDSKTLSIK